MLWDLISILFVAQMWLGQVPAAAAEPVSEGFGLAWAVMAVLALALLYALAAAVLAALGGRTPAWPGWAQRLIPVLCVFGLGVALYLTFVETTGAEAVCGPVGDCNEVQASPLAKLFGVLPVGLLGALGYVGILGAWAFHRFGRGTLARLAPLALFGMALFGVIFSMYLTYLELYIIKAVCVWCLTSAVIMAMVLVFSVEPAVSALSGE